MANPFVKVGNCYIGLSQVVEIQDRGDRFDIFSAPANNEGIAWEMVFHGQEAEDLRNWLRRHSDDAGNDFYKKRCAAGETTGYGCGAIISSTEEYCEKHREPTP